MGSFISGISENPSWYWGWIASVVVSICIHEFSHAFVAHRLGDDTAYKGGFMTLNPFKVMGIPSLIALFLFGIAWGAVPVGEDLEKKRFRMAGIALAGPAANFILALLLAGILHLLNLKAPTGWLAQVSYFLTIACYVNCILCIFNMLPLPILDGWNIWGLFLPKSLVESGRRSGALSYILIYVLGATPAAELIARGYDGFAGKILPQRISARQYVVEAEKNWQSGDYETFFANVEKAAAAGNSEGKALLGMCYLNGYGCTVDIDKAAGLLNEADVRDLPIAKLYRGIILMGENDTDSRKAAFELLSQEDVRDQPMAKLFLGLAWAEGYNGETDEKRAFELLSQEDVIVFPQAKFYVASSCIHGKVCPKDSAKAFALLSDKECSELPGAKFLLAMLYLQGEGVPQDFGKSAEYLQASADAGFQPAMSFLGYRNGQKPQFVMPLEKLLELHWQQLNSQQQ